jgi:hypothetical protein
VEEVSSTTAVVRGLAGTLSTTGNPYVDRGSMAVATGWAFTGSLQAAVNHCSPGAKEKQVNIPALGLVHIGQP